MKTTIVALALTLAVGASAEGYMFNTNLKKGMRNADVTALQTKLGVTPATGYFGNLTLAAVKAYQTANGISPVSGFVGPLTRASLNNSTTPSNPSTPTTPVVLNGQEGTGEFRLAAQPVDNTNVTTNTDVPVYGLEVKAKNADISVERVTLTVSVKNNTSYENPSTLINSIMVKDGSTVLTTIPVNSSTFSKVSGSSAGEYYLQLSGISTKVAKDTIKTLTVSVNSNSIDNNRTVRVSVGSMGVRVVDGRGISTYSQSGELTSYREHVFKKLGSATATLQNDSVIVYPTNYKVDSSNGAREALSSTFAVKSTTGPAKLTSVDVTVNATGTAATAVYLYQGSTLLASRSISGLNATTSFDIENSNVTVAQDTTSTFSIKVDVPSNATAATVKTTVTRVGYDKTDGSSDFATSTVAGPMNYFAPIVPQFSKTSSSLNVVKNGSNNAASGMEAKFVMNVAPQGGSLSTTLQAIVQLVGTDGTTLAYSTSTATVTGSLTDTGLATLGENTGREITFVKNFDLPSTGSYKAKIKSIIWTPQGGSAVTQTDAFDAFNTGVTTY